MTVHASTIRYLAELANGINQGTNPDFVKKISQAKAENSLDAQTVELAEKVLEFIKQAYKEQHEHTNPLIDHDLLASINCPELKEKIAPLIQQVLQLKPKPHLEDDTSLLKRIANVRKLLKEPLQIQSKDWTTTFYTVVKQIYDGVVHRGAEVVGVIGGVQIESEAEQITEQCETYKLKLYHATDSTVGQEFSRVTSLKVCELLKEHIINSKDYDPIVRPAFIKDTIFTDESAYTTTPELTGCGKLLSDLLTETPKEFEKIVELNLLKATNNLVVFLKTLQRKQPFFLVDLCTNCLKEAAHEVRQKQKPSLDTLQDIMKAFGQKSTEAIFNMAMPNGADDLVLPDLPGLGDSSARLPTARPLLWQLVSDLVKEQIDTFVSDIAGKCDLKNMLLIEGYEALLPALEGREPAAIARAGPAAIGIAAGTLPFAPIGFVYIFLKIVMTSIVSIFEHSPNITVEIPYPEQERFNKHFRTIANAIVEDSDSPFLQFVLRKSSMKTYVAEWGPKIVEAIREIRFIEIFNAQFESVVASVVNPGGRWVGAGIDRHYETVPLKIPKTLQAQVQKEAGLKAEEEARAVRVEELQQQIGNNIDGLLDKIASPYKLEHKTLTPEEQQVALKRIAHKVREVWVYIINALVTSLVKLAAFIINAKSKVKAASGAFHRQVKKIKQDTFVVAVGDFARKNLQAKS